MFALLCQGALAGGLYFFLKFQPWFAWLISASIVTFVTYGIDKFAAGRGWRRTPEWAIWALILAGGVVGGWCGQCLFRHKTRKWTFWMVLVGATLLYAVALTYFRDYLSWRRN
jgi:uncharacterized membrane protein YsdA (DUF1294 family)